VGEYSQHKGANHKARRTVTNFDGKVYEQTIVKAKGVKFLAKTITLPDVQVGSIIEYTTQTTSNTYSIQDGFER